MCRVLNRKLHQAKLEEGWQKAKVVRIELKDNVMTEFGSKDKTVFVFSVGADEVELKKTTSQSLHPKSGLSVLIQGLTGKLPGDSFNIDELEGMNCQVMIVHDIKESGDIWERIAQVKPAESEVK